MFAQAKISAGISSDHVFEAAVRSLTKPMANGPKLTALLQLTFVLADAGMQSLDQLEEAIEIASNGGSCAPAEHGDAECCQHEEELGKFAARSVSGYARPSWADILSKTATAHHVRSIDITAPANSPSLRRRTKRGSRSRCLSIETADNVADESDDRTGLGSPTNASTLTRTPFYAYR